MGSPNRSIINDADFNAVDADLNWYIANQGNPQAKAKLDAYNYAMNWFRPDLHPEIIAEFNQRNPSPVIIPEPTPEPVYTPPPAPVYTPPPAPVYTPPPAPVYTPPPPVVSAPQPQPESISTSISVGNRIKYTDAYGNVSYGTVYESAGGSWNIKSDNGITSSIPKSWEREGTFPSINRMSEPEPQSVQSPTTPSGYTEAKMEYVRGEITKEEFQEKTGTSPIIPDEVVPDNSNIEGARRTVESLDKMIETEINAMIGHETKVTNEKGGYEQSLGIFKGYDTFIQDNQFVGTEEQYSQYQKAYTDYVKELNEYQSAISEYESHRETFNPIVKRRNEIASGLGIAIDKYNKEVEEQQKQYDINKKQYDVDKAALASWNANPTLENYFNIPTGVSSELDADIKAAALNAGQRVIDTKAIDEYNKGSDTTPAAVRFFNIPTEGVSPETIASIKENAVKATNRQLAIDDIVKNPLSAGKLAGYLASGVITQEDYNDLINWLKQRGIDTKATETYNTRPENVSGIDAYFNIDFTGVSPETVARIKEAALEEGHKQKAFSDYLINPTQENIDNLRKEHPSLAETFWSPIVETQTQLESDKTPVETITVSSWVGGIKNGKQVYGYEITSDIRGRIDKGIHIGSRDDYLLSDNEKTEKASSLAIKGYSGRYTANDTVLASMRSGYNETPIVKTIQESSFNPFASYIRGTETAREIEARNKANQEYYRKQEERMRNYGGTFSDVGLRIATAPIGSNIGTNLYTNEEELQAAINKITSPDKVWLNPTELQTTFDPISGLFINPLGEGTFKSPEVRSLPSEFQIAQPIEQRPGEIGIVRPGEVIQTPNVRIESDGNLGFKIFDLSPISGGSQISIADDVARLRNVPIEQGGLQGEVTPTLLAELGLAMPIDINPATGKGWAAPEPISNIPNNPVGFFEMPIDINPATGKGWATQEVVDEQNRIILTPSESVAYQNNLNEFSLGFGSPEAKEKAALITAIGQEKYDIANEIIEDREISKAEDWYAGLSPVGKGAAIVASAGITPIEVIGAAIDKTIFGDDKVSVAKTMYDNLNIEGAKNQTTLERYEEGLIRTATGEPMMAVATMIGFGAVTGVAANVALRAGVSEVGVAAAENIIGKGFMAAIGVDVAGKVIQGKPGEAIVELGLFGGAAILPTVPLGKSIGSRVAESIPSVRGVGSFVGSKFPTTRGMFDPISNKIPTSMKNTATSFFEAGKGLSNSVVRNIESGLMTTSKIIDIPQNVATSSYRKIKGSVPTARDVAKDIFEFTDKKIGLAEPITSPMSDLFGRAPNFIRDFVDFTSKKTLGIKSEIIKEPLYTGDILRLYPQYKGSSKLTPIKETSLSPKGIEKYTAYNRMVEIIYDVNIEPKTPAGFDATRIEMLKEAAPEVKKFLQENSVKKHIIVKGGTAGGTSLGEGYGKTNDLDLGVGRDTMADNTKRLEVAEGLISAIKSKYKNSKFEITNNEADAIKYHSGITYNIKRDGQTISEVLPIQQLPGSKMVELNYIMKDYRNVDDILIEPISNLFANQVATQLRVMTPREMAKSVEKVSTSYHSTIVKRGEGYTSLTRAQEIADIFSQENIPSGVIDIIRPRANRAVKDTVRIEDIYIPQVLKLMETNKISKETIAEFKANVVKTQELKLYSGLPIDEYGYKIGKSYYDVYSGAAFKGKPIVPVFFNTEGIGKIKNIPISDYPKGHISDTPIMNYIFNEPRSNYQSSTRKVDLTESYYSYNGNRPTERNIPLTEYPSGISIGNYPSNIQINTPLMNYPSDISVISSRGYPSNVPMTDYPKGYTKKPLSDIPIMDYIFNEPRTDYQSPIKAKLPRGNGYPSDIPIIDYPFTDYPFTEKPPRTDYPFTEKPPRTDYPFTEKPPRTDYPFTEKPPRIDYPFTEKPPRTDYPVDITTRGYPFPIKIKKPEKTQRIKLPDFGRKQPPTEIPLPDNTFFRSKRFNYVDVDVIFGTGKYAQQPKQQKQPKQAKVKQVKQSKGNQVLNEFILNEQVQPVQVVQPKQVKGGQSKQIKKGKDKNPSNKINQIMNLFK